MDFILYGTDFCQLCDEALELVERVLENRDYQLTIVDISETDELMTKYAYRIPVLKRLDCDRLELDWPFAESDILALAE